MQGEAGPTPCLSVRSSSVTSFLLDPQLSLMGLCLGEPPSCCGLWTRTSWSLGFGFPFYTVSHAEDSHPLWGQLRLTVGMAMAQSWGLFCHPRNFSHSSKHLCRLQAQSWKSWGSFTLLIDQVEIRFGERGAGAQALIMHNYRCRSQC